MRTLVIHLGGIGDFLLSCVTLPALRRDGPVDLIGYRGRLQVAVDGGLADAAHDADAHDLQSLFAEPSVRLRRFLAPYDRCVAWLRPDPALFENLRGCGICAIDAHAGLPPDNWGDHASGYYLQCLGLDDPGPPRLAFEPLEQSELDVVIHPGSGGRHKNWPLASFLAVAEELRRRGRRVTWCAGPAEEGLPRLDPQLPAMPLARLARALAGARLYIGNDSGVTHLAAAAGCATLAVFGPTDPAVWAPRGENVTAIGGEGGGFPGVGEVVGRAWDRELHGRTRTNTD